VWGGQGPYKNCRASDDDNNNNVTEYNTEKCDCISCKLIINYVLILYSVRFLVLMAASMKVRAFWDIVSLELQYAPPKRRSNPTRLHGPITQKALIFITLYSFMPRRDANLIEAEMWLLRHTLTTSVNRSLLVHQKNIYRMWYFTF
jgi:hypothetical protein